MLHSSVYAAKNYNVAKVGPKCRSANVNLKNKKGSTKNTSKLLNLSLESLPLSDVKAPIVFSKLDSLLFLDGLKLPTDKNKDSSIVFCSPPDSAKTPCLIAVLGLRVNYYRFFRLEYW